MTSNQSSKFNQILKDNNDAYEYSILFQQIKDIIANQTILFFIFIFLYIKMKANGF